MTSYSKVFKKADLSMMNEVKVVSEPFVLVGSDEEMAEFQLKKKEEREKQETEAQVIISEAEAKAASLKAAAEAEIEQWWTESQQRLAILSEEIKHQAIQEGYELGKQQAVLEVEEAYEEKMNQVQNLLLEAYEQKAAIISEAEPFLLELSTAIASQILKQELDSHPEKLVVLIKQHIFRFKEKESITVCVSPDDFDFVESQRGHLTSVVNGETEVKIIPDHSVTSKGCIIRTAYGSVDARIDTQMEEIKKVLLEVRRTPDHDVVS